MGDAKRRREAGGADPIAAAAVRVDDACRDLAWETVRAGVPPVVLVDLLYRHLVVALASVPPALAGYDTATECATRLADDVALARARAVAAVSAPTRPEETVQ